jgi:hypothetical protein
LYFIGCSSCVAITQNYYSATLLPDILSLCLFIIKLLVFSIAGYIIINFYFYLISQNFKSICDNWNRIVDLQLPVSRGFTFNIFRSNLSITFLSNYILNETINSAIIVFTFCCITSLTWLLPTSYN